MNAYQLQILRLMEQARSDRLTGLGNYRAFREYCENLLGLRVPFSVILFDMTNLKRANETLGHFGADVLLNSVAQLIRGLDACFRHGGDEFAVVLPAAPPQGALATLTRIERIVGMSHLPDGTPVRVVGAVAHVPPGGDLNAELNRADRALENRKQAWKEATQPHRK